jgi:hypothetical protein
MTDANNCNNSLPEPAEEIVGVTGTLSAGCAGSGTGITIPNGGWYTISGGTCSTNSTIIIDPNGKIQISFDDIDLAVPVEEKEDNSDGCTCKKCQEFFPYAEPNQEDGTLVCYGCRMNW